MSNDDPLTTSPLAGMARLLEDRRRAATAAWLPRYVAVVGRSGPVESKLPAADPPAIAIVPARARTVEEFAPGGFFGLLVARAAPPREQVSPPAAAPVPAVLAASPSAPPPANVHAAPEPVEPEPVAPEPAASKPEPEAPSEPPPRLTSLRREIMARPRDEAPYYELIHRLNNPAGWPEAEAMLRQALERHGNLPNLHLYLARVLEWQGRIDDAIAATEAGLAAHEGHWRYVDRLRELRAADRTDADRLRRGRAGPQV